ncbi:MAG: hypothetical protein AAF328_10730 [Planctomycetota bacterium]
MAQRFTIPLLGVVTCYILAAAGHALNPELSEERFTERGFGLSIATPVDGMRDPNPEDGSVVAWDLGDRASIRLRIQRSPLVIESLEPLVDLTWKDSLYGLTTARPKSLEIKSRRIADRPALVQVAKLEPELPLYLQGQQKDAFDTRPLFFGQAMIKLGPFSVAAIDVYAPEEQRTAARALLEAVVESASLLSPPEMHDQRKAAFAAGALVLEGMDFDAQAKQATPDAWFELRRGGEAIGYARERWWTEPQEVERRDVSLPEPGFVSARYTSTRRANTELITQHEAYFSSVVDKEVWSQVSTLTTTRQQGGGVFEDQRVSSEWTETGVRNGTEISLVFVTPPDAGTVRDVFEGEWVRATEEIKQGLGPGVINQNQLDSQTRTAFVAIPERLPSSRIDGDIPIPPTDLYLNQAVLPLIPRVLTQQEKGAFAFYAYDSEAARLTLRAYTVEDLPEGQHLVTEQPTPWSPTTTYRFDARGKLIEMIRPGGMSWLPTRKDVLARQFPELR